MYSNWKHEPVWIKGSDMEYERLAVRDVWSGSVSLWIGYILSHSLSVWTIYVTVVVVPILVHKEI